MNVKIMCHNSDGSCNKTLIKIYEDNKLIVEKEIFYKDYIYLPNNKVFKLVACNYIGIVKTVFITNSNLKMINVIFNKNTSLIIMKVLDKYYPNLKIKKGVISLWQNMM